MRGASCLLSELHAPPQPAQLLGGWGPRGLRQPDPAPPRPGAPAPRGRPGPHRCHTPAASPPRPARCGRWAPGGLHRTGRCETETRRSPGCRRRGYKGHALLTGVSLQQATADPGHVDGTCKWSVALNRRITASGKLAPPTFPDSLAVTCAEHWTSARDNSNLILSLSLLYG